MDKSFTSLFSYRANDIENHVLVRVLGSGFWSAYSNSPQCVCVAFHWNMAEEKYLEFLLIRRPPISWEISNLRRGTSRILAYTKRKRRHRLLMITAAVLACNFHVDRQVWTVSRSSHWFEMLETAFSDEEWYGNFRLSRQTFHFLMTEIEGEIARKDTNMRQAFSSRKRLAITLCYLGSTAEYRTIGNLFGVSASFVCLCIKDVCRAITRKLKRGFLSVPRGHDLGEVMRLYKEKWGFSSCAGAIDGTHIPIQAPLENYTDYVNRKSCHSIVIQAVVDARLLVGPAVFMTLECCQIQNCIIKDSKGSFLILTLKKHY